MAIAPSRRFAFAVALTASLAALGLAPGPLCGTARADGALAVGLPEEGAQVGFAYGYATGWPAKEAAKRALAECRKQRGSASRTVRDLCRIVETFDHGCVAVAMDPKNGTPGVGWGVGDDRVSAERTAIAGCHETAGEGRRLSCKVDAFACESE
ncbi:MAG: DUF4189 domain-containing protein [Hyphomicrobiales bacterium]|nr:DUF4189 domain-containing protein [Hyphomicrobiales bacterium]